MIMMSLGFGITAGSGVLMAMQIGAKNTGDLCSGGKIEMPISDQVWGDYFGSFEDKFGVQWMVIYAYPKK